MLSVIINTKNAEATLEKALKSVQWADEIIVMDMHSTDKTVHVAKKYTDKIFQTDDVGYVEPARNAAIKKAKGDWMLIIDSDEEVPKKLRELIERVIMVDESQGAMVFAIARKNIVFDGWMNKAGWWPDYQIRLFRKGTVTWDDRIHSTPDIVGKVVELPADEELALLHHNYATIEEFIERLNRYTSKEVAARAKNPVYPSTLISGFRHELMSRLFHMDGVAAGTRGIGVSFLQAMYEVTVRLKQWQQQGFSDKDNKETYAELRALQQDIAYWLANWKVKDTHGIERFFWKVRRKLRL